MRWRGERRRFYDRTTAAAIAVAAVLALALTPLNFALSEELTLKEPVLFEADNLKYDSKQGVVTASGHVEASTGGRVLRADEVTYNQHTGVVTATGNVTLTEANGDTAFADSVELTDDLREGVIRHITMRMGEDVKLAANEGRRTGGNITELRNAVFSPCRICTEKGYKEPLWQIKAARVVHNQAEQKISYEDATFEFFGTPILWVPYFSHADPSVKRRSGFLVPGIGTSSDLGTFAEIPYYWAISEHNDITIAPFLTTEGGVALKGEYRELTPNGGYWFQGSVAFERTPDQPGTTSGEERAASHLFGHGRFDITDTWRWGFDAQLASNDTYMERFEISTLDRLKNNLFVEDLDGRNYAAVNGYYFQGLRETDDPGTTPYVTPLAEVSWYLPDAFLGGEVRLDGNLMVLSRNEGPDSRRLSGAVEWKLPFIADTGEAITLFASVRGDIYHTADLNPLGLPGVSDGDTVARILPVIGIDYRWPWIKTGENASYIVEPIVQLVASPNGGNPPEIPNEDSASFEFDETNLFNVVKFPGLDRWESGIRANVGLRGVAYFDQGGTIEVLVGQNFRFREDSAFPPDSGLGDQESDIVGRIVFAPDEHLSITNRFRLDKDDFSVRRDEIYVLADYSMFDLRASYVELAPELVGLGLGARQEVKADGRVYLTDYWSLIGSVRRDLEDDEMLDSRAGVIYEDECSVFELAYHRKYTRDRDAEPSTAIVFKIRLKALGNEGEQPGPFDW